MGLLHSKCDNITIISQCFYGSYSPFVHNVLDRSVPCFPRFLWKFMAMHTFWHPLAYKNRLTKKDIARKIE
jgi:hypothetical protein